MTTTANQQMLCATHENPDLWFSENPDLQAQARAVCAECPLRTPCAEAAALSRERHGIWGGLDARQIAKKNPGRRYKGHPVQGIESAA